MSETAKKDNERDKKKNIEEDKKPEKHGPKYIDFAKGFVIADNIRKEINDCERKLEHCWNDKYGYLSGDYFRKVLAEECAKAGLPVNTFERKLPENLIEKCPIPLKPSPKPVPRTSSAMVGWRSSRRDYDLEFVGPFHVSPKHTIEPPLIPGEFRVTRQNFIYLG